MSFFFGGLTGTRTPTTAVQTQGAPIITISPFSTKALIAKEIIDSRLLPSKSYEKEEPK